MRGKSASFDYSFRDGCKRNPTGVKVGKPGEQGLAGGAVAGYFRPARSTPVLCRGLPGPIGGGQGPNVFDLRLDRAGPIFAFIDPRPGAGRDEAVRTD